MNTDGINTGGVTTKFKPWQIQDLLVAIELGVTDNPILDYLDFFSSKIPIASASFLHVLPKFDLFNNLYERSASGMISNYELNVEVIDSMYGKLKAHKIRKHVLKLNFDVKEGNPLEELLQESKEINADLVVIGQRKGKVEHGILARNLVRKVACNAMIIPEDAPQVLQKVLVPIDFSRYSVWALQLALALQARMGDQLSIQCVNVYDMPDLSIYKTQRTFDQLKRMVEADRREAFRLFLQKHAEGHEDKIELALIERPKPGVAHFIAEFANQQQSDLIIMGAKGHSKVERLLLGSVTERLCSMDLQIPILVVK